jgi:hypothetical protein
MSGKGKYGFVRYANRSIATFNPGGTLPGSTMVTGINDEGTILGVYSTADSIPPCTLFCATWREIITIDVPGGEWTQPVAINAAGEIAGFYWFADNMNDSDVVTGSYAQGQVFGFLRIPQADQDNQQGVPGEEGRQSKPIMLP